MHDEKWESHWRSVLETVDLINAEQFNSRNRPDDSHLNRLEGRLGIPLPSSYRAFIKVFGPGALANRLTILSPGYRGSQAVDLLGQNPDWKQNDKSSEGLSEGGRLLWFAYFIHGPLCGWDTQLVTNQAESEYKVVCRRGPQSILPIADEFAACVEAVFADGGSSILNVSPVDLWLDEETGQMRSIRCFEPIVGSPRSSL